MSEGESLLPDYSERSRSGGPPRPEPVIDPERKALEDDVRIRDSTITELEQQKLKKQEEFDTLETTYEEARLSEMKEQLFFKIEMDRLGKKNRVVVARSEALARDMKDTSASMEYATLIMSPPADMDDKSKAESYVLKLQKQVIEAVEKMQVAPQRLQNLVDNFDEAVTKLRTQLMELVEERSRTEVQLKKQIGILNDEIKNMEDNYQERIQDSQEKIAKLRVRVEQSKTFEDLEEELEEADGKLEKLRETQQKQAQLIQKLEASKTGS